MLNTMGDKWDYHLRKIEIAWEIARKRLDTKSHAWDTVNDENFDRQVADILASAWRIVNDTFPRCD